MAELAAWICPKTRSLALVVAAAASVTVAVVVALVAVVVASVEVVVASVTEEVVVASVVAAVASAIVAVGVALAAEVALQQLSAKTRATSLLSKVKRQRSEFDGCGLNEDV